MRSQFHCTAEQPWAPEHDDGKCQVVHRDAKKVGDQRDGYPGGDLVTMRCPNCGTEWIKELPQ